MRKGDNTGEEGREWEERGGMRGMKENMEEGR